MNSKEQVQVKQATRHNDKAGNAFNVVATAFNRMLDAATLLAFPEYRNTVLQAKVKIQRTYNSVIVLINRQESQLQLEPSNVGIF